MCGKLQGEARIGRRAVEPRQRECPIKAIAQRLKVNLERVSRPLQMEVVACPGDHRLDQDGTVFLPLERAKELVQERRVGGRIATQHAREQQRFVGLEAANADEGQQGACLLIGALDGVPPW
jgi:hypothetical protein